MWGVILIVEFILRLLFRNSDWLFKARFSPVKLILVRLSLGMASWGFVLYADSPKVVLDRKKMLFNDFMEFNFGSIHPV